MNANSICKNGIGYESLSIKYQSFICHITEMAFIKQV